MESNTAPKKVRLNYVDVAKGICIATLVYFHMVNVYGVHIPLTFLVTTFRIPLFFFSSALFLKATIGFKEFMRKKTNQLIIPFFFWLLANAIILPILDPYMGNWTIPTFRELITNIALIPQNFYEEEYYINSIWFIWCLLLTTLIYYPIKKYSAKCKNGDLITVVSCLFIGAIGIGLSLLHINLPFFLDTTLTVLPFFMMGNMMKDKICSESKIKSKWLLLVAGIAALTVNYVLCYLIKGHCIIRDNIFNGMSWLTFYPLGLIGTLGIFMISRSLNNISILSYYGRHTLIILVTHRYIFQTIGYFLAKLPLTNGTAFGINLTLTLLSYLILIPVIKKLMPHVTAQKDVLKAA